MFCIGDNYCEFGFAADSDCKTRWTVPAVAETKGIRCDDVKVCGNVALSGSRTAAESFVRKPNAAMNVRGYPRTRDYVRKMKKKKHV
jgi:hypothetical protein